ncbi:MAG: polysaccharide deacetylase family protein [Bacilli bacterium]|nr:polysaccharide deacetylase family protein [Bacilli bacterium]
MANGEELKQSTDDEVNRQSVPVLNYHFFYVKEKETCNESICLETSKFREQLQYLKDNNFKTLTMEEFRKWMYGEIEIPSKSILLTVDDGALGTGKHNGNYLNPILEEYKLNATLFLITGWWDIENYRGDYLDIQSHTNDMHQYGTCGRGQINCNGYEAAKQDLAISLAVVQNNDSFCFPFYMTSSESLRAVKDVGFKLAFVGGNVDAKRTNNKWLVPRYPIQSDITLNQFINKVN